MRSLLLVAASLTLVLACGSSKPEARSPAAAASSDGASDATQASAEAMASGLLLDGAGETRVLGGAQPIPSTMPSGGGIVTGDGK